MPPSPSAASYETQVFDTGCVSTRPANLHDFFNALAWLAFPLTKATINALHAAWIPREGGKRGRFRDLLTLFDEGGAIVRCEDASLVELMRAHRWKELFWERRADLLGSLNVAVLGHAVLEQALEPWPGITCKVVVVPGIGEPDAQAADWLARLPNSATPAEMAALPIFGLPGWLPGADTPAFYDDQRYFRPLRRERGTAQGNT